MLQMSELFFKIFQLKRLKHVRRKLERRCVFETHAHVIVMGPSLNTLRLELVTGKTNSSRVMQLTQLAKRSKVHQLSFMYSVSKYLFFAKSELQPNSDYIRQFNSLY